MTVSIAASAMEVKGVEVSRLNRERFINQAYHAPEPWQFSALRKMYDLQIAPSHFSDQEGDRPSAASLMFARIAVANVTGFSVPSPVVCPVSGGSLGLIWSLGGKQLEVVFDSDHRGSYVLSQEDRIIADGLIELPPDGTLKSALETLLKP